MTRCPNCKEPVSQFAAGCAVCGADLEAARRAETGKRSLPRPRLPGVPQDLVVFVAMALLVLFAPLIGILLTPFVIRRQNASGQRTLRAALWCLIPLGVALVVLPATGYAGVLDLLYR